MLQTCNTRLPINYFKSSCETIILPSSLFNNTLPEFQQQISFRHQHNEHVLKQSHHLMLKEIFDVVLFLTCAPNYTDNSQLTRFAAVRCQHRPGGRDCFSFSAFSLSVMTRVYRYLLQRTLNFTLSLFFLIFTAVGQQQHAYSHLAWKIMQCIMENLTAQFLLFTNSTGVGCRTLQTSTVCVPVSE